MIDVLIIEDDHRIASEMQEMINKLDFNITICAVLSSVKQSLEWFESNPMPSLILSDIELSDGLCFDIFSSIDISVPVIFCTAYDQYALQAFENNGVAYLLKPIEQDKLQKIFTKTFATHTDFNVVQPDVFVNKYSNLMKEFTDSYKTSLLVFYKNKIIPVSVGDIQLIKYAFNMVYVFTDYKKYHVKEKLDDIMETLNPSDFFRANRQIIISRKVLGDIEQLSTRKLSVSLLLPDLDPVIISKEKVPYFLKWLEWS